MTTYKASVTSTGEANVYQAQVRDFKIKYDLTGRKNGYKERLGKNSQSKMKDGR